MNKGKFIESTIGYFIAWTYWASLIAGIIFGLLGVVWVIFKFEAVICLVIALSCWIGLRIHTVMYEKRRRDVIPERCRPSEGGRT